MLTRTINHKDTKDTKGFSVSFVSLWLKIEGRMPGQSVNAIHFRNESLSSRQVATIAFVSSSIVATIATMRTPAGS